MRPEHSPLFFSILMTAGINYIARDINLAFNGSTASVSIQLLVTTACGTTRCFFAQLSLADQVPLVTIAPNTAKICITKGKLDERMFLNKRDITFKRCALFSSPAIPTSLPKPLPFWVMVDAQPVAAFGYPTKYLMIPSSSCILLPPPHPPQPMPLSRLLPLCATKFLESRISFSTWSPPIARQLTLFIHH